MKWSQLPYRKKTFYLGLAFLLLLALSYQFSIRKTIQTYLDNTSLAQQLRNVENAPQRIARLTREISRWETSTISAVTTEELQIRLFNNVSRAVDEFAIHLSGLKEVEAYNEKGFDVRVYEITARGSYTSLVRFVHSIENRLAIGKIVSARFETTIDRHSRKEVLILKAYVQSILKHSNDPS